MIKRILALLLVLCTFSFQVQAGDSHWAEKSFKEIYQLDGIIVDEPDSPANISLQEKVYKICRLNISPEKGLMRYWLLKSMVDTLGLFDADEVEVAHILRDYKDLCVHCFKANQVLAMAEKSSLLRGRLKPEGLVTAAKDPVTNAELVAFALRYLRIKCMNNLPKNGIINLGVDTYE
ncbi:MAG: hypothetical protein CVU87_11600 [Firmicutes bacterium HGW-Firmicutes-12]|jgi:hypothetical protein|nr:MAG: hypothetical protein CVU87_11600 [Firmicutes bacterium HGW-Firmicutes-12]